ncbi:MAG: YybH family protein [Acidiferrobacterales bacterium]
MTTSRYATPVEAEEAFYAAFEAADLAAMMAIWAQHESITCIHPLGPMLVGRGAIEQSWQAIFGQSVSMKFKVERRCEAQDGSLAVHVVYEHIQVTGEQQSHTVIATNAYRLTAGGWCMILHHASPDPRSVKEPTLH